MGWDGEARQRTQKPLLRTGSRSPHRPIQFTRIALCKEGAVGAGRSGYSWAGGTGCSQRWCWQPCFPSHHRCAKVRISPAGYVRVQQVPVAPLLCRAHRVIQVTQICRGGRGTRCRCMHGLRAHRRCDMLLPVVTLLVASEGPPAAYRRWTGPRRARMQRRGPPGQILCDQRGPCLLYTSPSPRDQRGSRMPSSA